MHVIGHQAISPDLDAGLAALLGQQIGIKVLIPILNEDRLATVSSRRDAVGNAGNNDASDSGHSVD